MAYATTLKFAELSGLGIRVVNENVGTGDVSETSFDLDNGNVVSGSYTLKYAASGSNDFTDLTETTHYSLDKESGAILLTEAGKTALGTNILYATYWYTDNFSDTVISDMLDKADSEIEWITGKIWDTPILEVEYQDGVASSGYPTTDRPYAVDYDKPDELILKEFPVTKIDQIYFLTQGLPIAKAYNYDDGSSTYTEIQDSLNYSTEAPVALFDAAPAVGDYIYVGSNERFLGLNVNLGTVGTGSPSIDWEYYDGSSWTDLSETDVDSGASTFTASGKFTWTYPYGWSATTVNGYSAYWIRGKLTGGYTIDPVCATMTSMDGLSDILEPREYTFKSNGVVYITGSSVPDGAQNIRIDYYHGYDTTPSFIEELAVLYAAVQAYVNLSGGSYDDATSYTLGTKSVTIGEVYVNIREVISQFKAKIAEILATIGKRADVKAI